MTARRSLDAQIWSLEPSGNLEMDASGPGRSMIDGEVVHPTTTIRHRRKSGSREWRSRSVNGDHDSPFDHLRPHFLRLGHETIDLDGSLIAQKQLPVLHAFDH